MKTKVKLLRILLTLNLLNIFSSAGLANGKSKTFPRPKIDNARIAVYNNIEDGDLSTDYGMKRHFNISAKGFCKYKGYDGSNGWRTEVLRKDRGDIIPPVVYLADMWSTGAIFNREREGMNTADVFLRISCYKR